MKDFENEVNWFFENMKVRGVLPQVSELCSWSFDKENVYFRYQVYNKTFGYRIAKSSVLIFLRDWKLNQII
jgi:hypothetical protein